MKKHKNTENEQQTIDLNRIVQNRYMIQKNLDSEKSLVECLLIGFETSINTTNFLNYTIANCKNINKEK